MCGICGFCGFEDKQLLRRMARNIEHRGPDENGFFSDKSVSIASQRLKIIDLSEKGRQPIFNEDKTVAIVFNGEIYNYLELRKGLEAKGHRFYGNSDTETIVHGYEEYGQGVVKMLNGDFAFAIYDLKKQLIFLARDRLGIKPLYYFFDGRRLLFASEIKAILEEPDVKRAVNRNAMNLFISLRFIPGEETIFEGIKKLQPAHTLTYDVRRKAIEVIRFWDIDCSDGNIIKGSEGFFAEKILRLFEDSVERRLMSDVPLGVYLSGGIDSSSVVAMMSRIRKRENRLGSYHVDNEIRTFSVGFGYGEETDELRHAKLVSDYFGTNHNEFIVSSDLVKLLPKIVWHCDEPLADPALIPVYLLSEKAKKHVTVVLTGDGGDELFAGYEQHKFMKLINATAIPGIVRGKVVAAGLKVVPKAVLNKFFRYASSLGDRGVERAVRALSTDDSLQQYLEIVSIFNEKEKQELFAATGNNSPEYVRALLSDYFREYSSSALNNFLTGEFKTVLPENFLMKADKMAAAHAVESRVPFLDHRLVELSFQIPPSLKLHGMSEKYIFRKAMSGLVPEGVLSRKKQRFYVPIDKWIKSDIKPLMQDFLSEKEIRKQGFFSYSYVEKAFRNYKSSPLFYGRQLWSLLTFQLWHKIFIEGERPTALA